MFRSPYKRPCILSLLAMGLACALPAAARASLILLYDGNGLPAQQSWLAYADDAALSNGTASQSSVSGGVSLVTDNAVSAGYSNYGILGLKNPAFPTLDRAQGFELRFSAELTSEAHVSNDRAGFSVILLGSDSKGIELGFWEDEIWAQTSSPAFTHGSGVAIDTTVRRDYRLAIQHDNFQLSEGSTVLLDGAIQDYQQPALPYALSNFLFLGDNTSSARASVLLGPMFLQSNLSAVPEPSSACLLGLCTLGLALRRRERLTHAA